MCSITARSFGIPTAVFRMSCIYGQRQMGTEDQGWVAHFLIRALEGQPITIYGDGRQVRDILDVGDAVDAYVARLAQHRSRRRAAPSTSAAGRRMRSACCSCSTKSARITGRDVELRFEDWRQGDQRWFVADTQPRAAALDLPTAARLARRRRRLADGWRASAASSFSRAQLASAAE